MLASSVVVNFCARVSKYAEFTLTDWRKATGKESKLLKHETSSAHGSAFESYTARVKELDKTSSSVAVNLSKAYAKKLQQDNNERARNREVLAVIADNSFFSETEH